MDDRQRMTAMWSAGGVTALVLALLCRRRRRRCCDPSVGGWTGPPAWDGDGQMVNTDAFRSFMAQAMPCWRHDAVSVALAILGVAPGGDAPTGPVTVERAPSAGSGEVDVTLTYDHEGDDSVAATRYRFLLVDEAVVDGTPGVFRLLEGHREFRCQPGRGQTDWGTDLCL